MYTKISVFQWLFRVRRPSGGHSENKCVRSQLNCRLLSVCGFLLSVNINNNGLILTGQETHEGPIWRPCTSTKLLQLYCPRVKGNVPKIFHPIFTLQGPAVLAPLGKQCISPLGVARSYKLCSITGATYYRLIRNCPTSRCLALAENWEPGASDSLTDISSLPSKERWQTADRLSKDTGTCSSSP